MEKMSGGRWNDGIVSQINFCGSSRNGSLMGLGGMLERELKRIVLYRGTTQSVIVFTNSIYNGHNNIKKS